MVLSLLIKDDVKYRIIFFIFIIFFYSSEVFAGNLGTTTLPAETFTVGESVTITVIAFLDGNQVFPPPGANPALVGCNKSLSGFVDRA